MRVTREVLLKLAEDTVSQRTRKDRSILAVYLSGALLGDDYLLGGTADIDLTFVHLDIPPVEREVVRISDEVHLDIAHYSQKEFRQTRGLRLHPWLGPTIFECKVIHDPQHFMDFTQASVRGQFDRSDHVLGRARSLAEHARQMWTSFYTHLPEQPGAEDVLLYLRAVEHAANAVASLNGAPLTERRLLLNFPARAQAVGKPGLYPGLLGLLGAPHADAASLSAWLAEWETAYDSLPPSPEESRLHPDRKNYYRKGMEALAHSDQPQTVLWPLVRTWTLLVNQQAQNAQVVQPWQSALERLGLLGAGFGERIQALDAFLDMVEEVLEEWANETGG